MEKNELITRLLTRAEAAAEETYGCGLDRLDPAEVEWFKARVVVQPWTMWELVEEMAAAAWMAY